MGKKKTGTDFGQGFQELEDIAKWFELGEPDLEKGLEKFERAMELSCALKERLTDAENKIKEIRVRHGKTDEFSSPCAGVGKMVS